MQRSLFIVAMMVVACGGSSAPASSPADEKEPAEHESSSAGDESGKGEGDTQASKGEPKGGESKESKFGAAASTDDTRAVLQLVIDDESLDPFLHLTEPGRFPLQISGPNMPDGLIKATKPVKIVDSPGSKTDPVLVFTEIDIQGKHATVRYRYDIEGMQGSATLDKKDHGWELTRSKVVERSATMGIESEDKTKASKKKK